MLGKLAFNPNKMINRLTFSESNHPALGWGYEVHNDKGQNICAIRKIRTGQWMHWSIVFEFYHLAEDTNIITISPGCQDEIRAKCKELNAHKIGKEYIVDVLKEALNKIEGDFTREALDKALSYVKKTYNHTCD